MKKSVLALLVMGIPAASLGAVASDIPPAQKRMEAIDLARSLLTTEEKSLDIDQRNPFNPVRVPTGTDVVTPVIGEAAASDREILLGVSESIAPSGMMQLGDTPILLFGQKKLKVGDSIQIMFQGASHEIEIAGIERTSFSLRLNKEEMTRPIKPR